jgi:hypothetical protein
MTFSSSTPFEVAHPHALAIYCSDGRFTQPVEDLLHSLGHARLDTVTMPGGPGLLNHLSASYADADAMTRSASFLIRAHAIKEVVLLAHHGCGYYKHKRPIDAPEQIEHRQLDDLRHAAKAIAKVDPAIVVHLYFARPVGGHVKFEPLVNPPRL